MAEGIYQSIPGGLVPVQGQSGVFYDPKTQRRFNIRDEQDADRYDTVFLPAGLVAAGTQFIFFRDMLNKNRVDANFPTPNYIASAKEVLTVHRIGIHPLTASGGTISLIGDIRQVVESLYIEVFKNNDRVDEGPAIKFQSGYGLVGATTENLQSIVSVGVPSGAAQKLRRPIVFTENDSVTVTATFQARAWAAAAAAAMPTLAAELMLRCYMRGVLGRSGVRG